MPTYVRVKDPSTRHEFDMPDGHPHIAKGLVEVVKPKLYPPSPLPRRPKHHLKLAPPSAARDTAPSTESAADPIAIEETQHG